MTSFGWAEVITFCGFAAILLLIKCCLLNCCVISRRYERPIRLLDSSSTMSSTIDLSHRTEEPSNAIPVNESPPHFEYAVKNCVPISVIQIDEQPPPSYEQYLKMLQYQVSQSIPLDQRCPCTFVHTQS